MAKYYYTYYSYEQWGRGYIGRRGCTCSPEEDIEYFGSYKNKSYRPTHKIILGVYKTEAEAITAEVKLHAFFDVDINPHFANKARQKTVGFSFSASGKENPRYGKTFSHTPEAKNKISQAHKTKKWWNNGVKSVFCDNCPKGFVHGRIPPSDKTRELMSKKRKGKDNPMYGRGGKSHPLYGKKWYTDGVLEVFTWECPKGYKRGRKPLKRRSKRHG